MSLKDTLQQLKSRSEAGEEAVRDRPKLLAEWQQAIISLYADLKSWLADYESGGLVKVSEDSQIISEEALDVYPVQTLRIDAGPVTVSIRPVGRHIIGALGRVDMHVFGKTMEHEKVLLLRVSKDAATETAWQISKPLPSNARAYTAGKTFVPLTRAAFEEVLSSLLSDN